MILAKEQAGSPSTPATGYSALYVKSDGKWYRKDDSGNEVELHPNPDFHAPTLGTVTALSGTTSTITGVPSWAKVLHVSIASMSASGTSIPQLRLGTSGGVENSGYTGAVSGISTVVSTLSHSTGFQLLNAGAAAASVDGVLTLVLLDPAANTWALSGGLDRNDTTATYTTRGKKSLSGTLDRLQLTMANGTDTFDGGSWNYLVIG